MAIEPTTADDSSARAQQNGNTPVATHGTDYTGRPDNGLTPQEYWDRYHCTNGCDGMLDPVTHVCDMCHQ